MLEISGHGMTQELYTGTVLQLMKPFPMSVQVTNSEPTIHEQINKWKVDGGNQISHCWSEKL